MAITNRSFNRTTPNVADSQSHGSGTHPSVTLSKKEKENTFLNKICSYWHIPCWTINLSLLPFYHAAIYCEKEVVGEGRFSAPYVSTDEETGSEKSFTCGHTHESRESSHYEPCSVQTERWQGTAVSSYRWLCITSNERCGKTGIYEVEEKELLKMLQLWRTERRVENYLQSVWRLITFIWMLSSNPDRSTASDTGWLESVNRWSKS